MNAWAFVVYAVSVTSDFCLIIMAAISFLAHPCVLISYTCFRKDPQCARPLEGLKIIDVGCGGGILSEVFYFPFSSNS